MMPETGKHAAQAERREEMFRIEGAGGAPNHILGLGTRGKKFGRLILARLKADC